MIVLPRLFRMYSISRLYSSLVLVLVSIGFASARADLDEYIKKPDPAFAWSQISSVSSKAGVVTSIKLTSQVWQGITWNHDLRVYEPRDRSSRRDAPVHHRRRLRAQGLR